jgi:hypothetical protein
MPSALASLSATTRGVVEHLSRSTTPPNWSPGAVCRAHTRGFLGLSVPFPVFRGSRPPDRARRPRPYAGFPRPFRVFPWPTFPGTGRGDRAPTRGFLGLSVPFRVFRGHVPRDRARRSRPYARFSTLLCHSVLSVVAGPRPFGLFRGYRPSDRTPSSASRPLPAKRNISRGFTVSDTISR